MTATTDYKLLSDLANVAEAGGLAKERSVLLLWFLRNVIGLDDLDAYEFVCDGDLDGGIDGLFLEPSSGDDDHETLVIYQSKFTTGPTPVGPNSLNRLVTVASQLKDATSLTALLAGSTEPKLATLIQKFGLVAKLTEGRFKDRRLRLRLVLVTSGILNGDAQKLVSAINRVERTGYLTVYDLNRLGPLARSVAAPSAATTNVSVRSSRKERLIMGSGANRVAMVSVRASDIVQWPGIDDRSLFELNVRRELRRNRVRDQLDGAIRRPHDHKDFLAYHNGMTVVCDSFEEKRGGLILHNPSIVNGAQSAIAFAVANNEGALTDQLRIFIKIVEVAGRRQLAKEVSWRSNTQTAVNARNLVALGGPQTRLKKEIEQDYPGIIYETRPDATIAPRLGTHVISNDDAAQLLCAIFNAMPWLAVKRLSLFESENHAMIFPPEVTGAHIVLADFIRQRVDAQREIFPERYRQSWRLTRVVAIYLVGEILRSDEAVRKVLTEPGASLRHKTQLEKDLDLPIRVAAGTLNQRRNQHDLDSQADEFNAEFKNTEILHGLRDQARNNYSLYRTVGAPPARSKPRVASRKRQTK